MASASRGIVLPAHDYDLAITLTSGQAFRWRSTEEGWEGVIGSRWVRLRQLESGIVAAVAEPVADWRWLAAYLRLEEDLAAILSSFPSDSYLQAAVTACRGLRLLRQDPWECLASFILSATKQIVQIQQIIAVLCEHFGQPVAVPPGHPPAFAFPTARELAARSEAELRACRMGFRAPNLLETARIVAEGRLDLSALGGMEQSEAGRRLQTLPGVGPKIANCVLLFAYAFPRAFPVDVWVMRALRNLYFPRRRPTRRRLEGFIDDRFGPYAGYAQQYLFHYIRTRKKVDTRDREP